MQLRRKYFWIVLIFAQLYSCSEPDSRQEEFDENPNEFTPLPTSIIIDSTDLKDLPKDTGGVHTAYPLGTTDAIFGHLVYTPSGYAEDGPEYPLLIFLHGWDPNANAGTDEEELNKVRIGNTPPGLIEKKRWNPTYPFIVVSPRLKTTYWPHEQIHDFIKYIIDHYQINRNRIYLTGLSLGGGGTWYYVGERGIDNYVAAIVPISARGEERIIDNLTDVPIWAFHGDSDNTVLAFKNYGSVPLVQRINNKNPMVKARVTVFKDTGHDAWSKVYLDAFTTNVIYDPFDVSIYDWMLQFKKD